ncbi:alpha/beta hydrolase [Alicyclobacillus tolerans]|uniref:alpha/beta hydrolase n=1 Tax=Alicyclobacillus tolerans TaxID=90970 RepID=UPI001F2F22E2|nr:alpha/beta hydrolase [Alicyclobacillus tolerans]MCF8565562.1 alpha/beta hydrolase [Alicyclobacillus tolerans]
MDMDKKIHPDLKAVFAKTPAVDFTDLTALRDSAQLEPAPRSERVSISTRQIAGSNDAPGVLVRIFEPVERNGLLPAVLWIHGGGYILGSYQQDDGLCQRFVETANCLVVSVEYRLAPEHPFPAPMEDCYAALKWLAESANELGVDDTRIAIAGSSAGGGLTAGLALLARDRGGPHVCFQMPLYPMIDDRNVTPSSREITDNRVWNRDANAAAWKMYLGEEAKDNVSPYAAASRAKDLSGLPPAYICVGELDAFRDETMDYVTRLQQAGVPVEFHLYPGCFHGFELTIPDADISKRAAAEYVSVLARALAKA